MENRMLPDGRVAVMGGETSVTDPCAVGEALLARSRADGLFYDVVDDSRSFVETNLSQMLCYSMRRGMEDGWLPRRYEAPATMLRTAVHEQVDAYGFVRGVCGAPRFDAPGIAPEGQAFFLLMEQAVEDDLSSRQKT